MAWPYLGPFPPQGPMREDNPDLDRVGGHPTAQGALDRDENYPRLPVTQVSAKNNGIAGRPRYKSLGTRHGKAGGMIVGPVPTGPMQPGVEYDSGTQT